MLDIIKQSGLPSGTEEAPILAFDIGGTRVKAGIVRGADVSDFRIKQLDAQESTDHLTERLTRLRQEMSADWQIQALGISVKGFVDPQQGIILDVKEALVDLIG